jgi:hypothetical protein
MCSLKADVFEICKDVVTEFPGWTFASGQFKNSTLKHTDLLIQPGFAFRSGTTPVQPGVAIDNKRANILCKRILGATSPISNVSLQVVAHLLKHMPEGLRLGFWIAEDRAAYLSVGDPSQVVKDRTIDVTEARSALAAMLEDGVIFINNHYDLSSEEALLRALPARYSTRHEKSPYDEMDKWKGVMLCIVHILIGDFDFVERYRSDDLKTIFPKRMLELDKIMAALPDLKRRYQDSGSVI